MRTALFSGDGYRGKGYIRCFIRNYLVGVFDDPENIGYAGAGVRVEGTSPTLFVNTAAVSQLKRMDALTINGRSFWVDRIGPDDCGSCHIWLGNGSPPASSRRR